MIRLLKSVRGDERGTTVMEFGLMVTVFMTLLLGIFDIGQLAYTQAILNGAVQDAARTSSLETGDTAVADTKVQNMVKLSAPGVTVATSRISYFDFADVDRPESWNDVNNSGDCDNGESYSDENGNGSWDADIGVSGNGGAGDVVIYTVTATYDPLFPNPFMTTGNAARTLKSSAVKKNQPFADQAGYGSAAGTC